MESPDSILQAIFDQTALGIAQISLDGVWLRVNDLVHNAHRIEMRGDSMRKNRGKPNA
jgi:hypothetical protein